MKKGLIIINILLACTSIYLGGKIYFTGNQAEKEELLSSTIWELYSQGYTKEDIESIRMKYNPTKGGALPYETAIVFKEDPSVMKMYNWDSTKKEKVVLSQESAS
ncbi:MAG: DUF3139 domain-containing protein [Clostridium sp.]